MITRKQVLFKNAYDRITDVKSRERKDVANAYGGLCHKFPILVRNNGLAQTCAWIEAKASGNQENSLNRAYAVLRDHVAATLSETTDGASVMNGSQLLQHVVGIEARTYMRETLLLMDAWVYHKRFAVSILKVQDGSEVDADAPTSPGEVTA